MFVSLNELELSGLKEIEEYVVSIPLKGDSGTLCAQLAGDHLIMFLIPPNLEELLDAGYTDDEAAPVVTMSPEDSERLVTYIRKVVA